MFELNPRMEKITLLICNFHLPTKWCVPCIIMLDECFPFANKKRNNTAQTQEAIRKLWERKGVAGNFYEVADVLKVATGPCT